MCLLLCSLNRTACAWLSCLPSSPPVLHRFHFTTCEVEAVGPGVTQLQLGDRVALEPGVPCCAHHQYRQGRGKRAARLHVGAAIS